MSSKDDYSASSKSALKLKGVKDPSLKKKKKKKSKKDVPAESQQEVLDSLSESASKVPSGGYSATRTQAEIHFMNRQRAREEQRIRNKASKSHKEKVEEFNRNLDSQSEHFDIPKVSWTK